MSRNQVRDKAKFLEALKKMPHVENACRQANVPRATIFAWRRQDPIFARDWQRALEESYPVLTDLAVAALIKQLQDGNMAAVALTLTRMHPAFMASDRFLEVKRGELPVPIYHHMEHDDIPPEVADRLIRDAGKSTDREVARRARKLAREMMSEKEKE